jgi:hypothetical protein
MPIPSIRTTTTTPTTTSRSRRTSNTSASSRRLGGDFSVSDKAYTYYYNNDSHENSVDPVVGGTVTKVPGPPTPGRPTSTTRPTRSRTRARASLPRAGIINDDDPGGRIKVNAYRAEGDYLALVHGEDSWLEEQVGVWAEYVRADRYAYLLDYSPPTWRPIPRMPPRSASSTRRTRRRALTFKPGYQWFMHVYNKTFQPYADLIWKPIKNLTIEAGVKDSNFTIDLEAPVNQGTESRISATTPTRTGAPLLRQLPVHAELVGLRAGGEGDCLPDRDRRGERPERSRRILAATGTTYNPANLKEEQTINYQVGTVFKTDRFNADADVYLIDINNLVSSVTDPNDSTNTLYFQSKGAWVSGLEVEGTYYVGGGLSVYANGSLNRATYKTDAGVPDHSTSLRWVPSGPTACRIRRPPSARSSTGRAGSPRSPTSMSALSSSTRARW